jgi:hypothetical protein
LDQCSWWEEVLEVIREDLPLHIDYVGNPKHKLLERFFLTLVLPSLQFSSSQCNCQSLASFLPHICSPQST